MRILVCGGRDFNDYATVAAVLYKLAVEHSICYKSDDNWLPHDFVIIEGGAKGADRMAADWAAANWCKIEEYPADWDKHGKSAGYVRNAEMLEKGKPDLVVAFPGGKGTAMMERLAEKAGVKVVRIT